MSFNNISSGERETFYRHLQDQKGADYTLVELWFVMKEPHRPFEHKDRCFDKDWISNIKYDSSVKKKSKFEQLQQMNEAATPEGAKPPHIAKKYEKELLDLVNDELDEIYQKYTGSISEEAKQEAETKRREEAKRLLAPARAKQKTAVLAAKEGGLLWHVDAAADGQPFTVVSSSLTRRPAPSLVKLGAAAEGDKTPRKTLSARFRWTDGELRLEVIDGDRTLVPRVGETLGVPNVREGKITDPNVGGDKKLFDRLARMSTWNGLGTSGHFWYIVAFPDGRKAMLILRPTKESDLEKLVEGLPYVHGSWTREITRRRIHFKLENSSQAYVARDMAAMLRKRAIHRLERVEVSGNGFHLLDPRFKDGKEAEDDKAWKTRLLSISQENTRLARQEKGHLWFTDEDRDGNPLAVLYRELQPVFDKKLLVRQHGAPVPGTLASWERDATRRVIVVTILGQSTLSEKLRKHLVAARIFPETRFEVKVGRIKI